MNCIIIDDEPLAREGMLLLVNDFPGLRVVGCFNGVKKAREFLAENQVDLIFLDIQMPGVNGLEFAQTIAGDTLIIFTTAYSQYALKSYEVDAIDYLVKPILKERFEKAINKAVNYQQLLLQTNAKSSLESVASDFMLIKAERKFYKIVFKDILYIEGLKDYVVMYVNDNKIITAMNLKTIYHQLPQTIFVRVSKSYVVNMNHILSFDNHTIYLNNAEIPIGDIYRKNFMDLYLGDSLSGKL